MQLNCCKRDCSISIPPVTGPSDGPLSKSIFTGLDICLPKSGKNRTKTITKCITGDEKYNRKTDQCQNLTFTRHC